MAPGVLDQRDERRVLGGEDRFYLGVAHPLSRALQETYWIRHIGTEKVSEVYRTARKAAEALAHTDEGVAWF
jgi:hypothetical protein